MYLYIYNTYTLCSLWMLNIQLFSRSSLFPLTQLAQCVDVITKALCYYDRGYILIFFCVSEILSQR